MRQLLSKLIASLTALSCASLAIFIGKQHVLETSHVLALACTTLAATSFFVRLYFERLRSLCQIAGLMLLVTAATTSYANWLPQFQGGFPPPDVKLDIDSMTPQQLADEGEKIIFGEIGKSQVQGAIGRGQCPLCHVFSTEYGSDMTMRAPNLWGITARKRLKDTSIEYIAESHVCPSCYVIGGYGVKGTEDQESPMPAVHKPPISLSIDDLIAVDTWLFWHEGGVPPPPEEIRVAYEKLIPPNERPKGPQEEIPRFGVLLADGEEPVNQIFAKAQCVSCHIIPGIPGATGSIGPKLTMKTDVPARLKDKRHVGRAKTVREYITESILYPSVYVTSGYPDNTMPKVFGGKLSALAIDKMVDYLAVVEEGKAPPPIK